MRRRERRRKPYLLRHAVAPLDASQRILVTVVVVVVETGTGGSRGRALHDVALRPRERPPRLALAKRLALARLLLLLLRLLVGALELEEVFDLFFGFRVSVFFCLEPVQSWIGQRLLR